MVNDTWPALPVADFYTEVMAMLGDLGLATSIWTMPVEIPDAIPFDDVLLDFLHTTYAAAADTARWNRKELER